MYKLQSPVHSSTLLNSYSRGPIEFALGRHDSHHINVLYLQPCRFLSPQPMAFATYCLTNMRLVVGRTGDNSVPTMNGKPACETSAVDDSSQKPREPTSDGKEEFLRNFDIDDYMEKRFGASKAKLKAFFK